MKRKIKTKNYDGTIIEVEVNINVYNYDKENYWQEDWRARKSKQEYSYESVCSYYEKNGLPLELQEESSEDTYLRNFEYEQLYKAIDSLPSAQRRRVILRYFHGLTLQQIADVEHVSLNAVEISVKNAQKRIKKVLCFL